MRWQIPFTTLRLAYRPALSGTPTHQAPLGKYIGSGDGTAEGHGLGGAVRWELFENQGPVMCDGFFAGEIITADGSAVGFRALVYLRRPDAESSRWSVAGTIRFQVADGQPETVPRDPAVLEGHFDAVSYRHEYRVYAAG